jgi:hypothetical protein
VVPYTSKNHITTAMNRKELNTAYNLKISSIHYQTFLVGRMKHHILGYPLNHIPRWKMAHWELGTMMEWPNSSVGGQNILTALILTLTSMDDHHRYLRFDNLITFVPILSMLEFFNIT